MKPISLRGDNMKIYQNFQAHGYWTVIEKDGKHYYFDLSPVYKLGPECMGFSSDENGEVVDWSEVYVSRPSEVSPEALKQCVMEFMNNTVR